MPTKNGFKQTAIKAERPKVSKRFTKDACGYKRTIRLSKPDNQPFSHSYVAGNIEANLLSAYRSLDQAVGTLKDSGLTKIHPSSNSPLGHIKALLSYALMLGRHIRGDSNSAYFKEYISKIDDIEDWNGMFPINNVGTN